MLNCSYILTHDDSEKALSSLVFGQSRASHALFLPVLAALSVSCCRSWCCAAAEPHMMRSSVSPSYYMDTPSPPTMAWSLQTLTKLQSSGSSHVVCVCIFSCILRLVVSANSHSLSVLQKICFERLCLQMLHCCTAVFCQ